MTVAGRRRPPESPPAFKRNGKQSQTISLNLLLAAPTCEDHGGGANAEVD
jgi:hypothetical protein